MPPGNPLSRVNRSDKGGIGRVMALATTHASRDAPEPDSHLQRTTTTPPPLWDFVPAEGGTPRTR
jgi:hypothetical protein